MGLIALPLPLWSSAKLTSARQAEAIGPSSDTELRRLLPVEDEHQGLGDSNPPAIEPTSVIGSAIKFIYASVGLHPYASVSPRPPLAWGNDQRGQSGPPSSSSSSSSSLSARLVGDQHQEEQGGVWRLSDQDGQESIQIRQAADLGGPGLDHQAGSDDDDDEQSCYLRKADEPSARSDHDISYYCHPRIRSVGQGAGKGKDITTGQIQQCLNCPSECQAEAEDKIQEEILLRRVLDRHNCSYNWSAVHRSALPSTGCCISSRGGPGRREYSDDWRMETIFEQQSDDDSDDEEQSDHVAAYQFVVTREPLSSARLSSRPARTTTKTTTEIGSSDIRSWYPDEQAGRHCCYFTYVPGREDNVDDETQTVVYGGDGDADLSTADSSSSSSSPPRDHCIGLDAHQAQASPSTGHDEEDTGPAKTGSGGSIEAMPSKLDPFQIAAEATLTSCCYDDPRCCHTEATASAYASSMQQPKPPHSHDERAMDQSRPPRPLTRQDGIFVSTERRRPHRSFRREDLLIEESDEEGGSVSYPPRDPCSSSSHHHRLALPSPLPLLWDDLSNKETSSSSTAAAAAAVSGDFASYLDLGIPHPRGSAKVLLAVQSPPLAPASFVAKKSCPSDPQQPRLWSSTCCFSTPQSTDGINALASSSSVASNLCADAGPLAATIDISPRHLNGTAPVLVPPPTGRRSPFRPLAQTIIITDTPVAAASDEEDILPFSSSYQQPFPPSKERAVVGSSMTDVLEDGPPAVTTTKSTTEASHPPNTTSSRSTLPHSRNHPPHALHLDDVGSSSSPSLSAFSCSSSSTMSIGSPEDIYLTPRAGSPFVFPTTGSRISPPTSSFAIDDGSAAMEPSNVYPHDSSRRSSLVAGPSESEETLGKTIRQGGEGDEEGSNHAGSQAVSPTSSSSAARLPSTSALPASPSGSSIRTPSMSPSSSSKSTLSAYPAIGEADLPARTTSIALSPLLSTPPPRPARRSSLSPPISLDQPIASLAAASSSSSGSSPVTPAAWTSQLRESLIAEGLTETAVTAVQEIRALTSGTVVPSGGSDMSGLGTDRHSEDIDGPSSPSALHSIAMSEKKSASSEISRTPSTSTSGSVATSSASADTAPSSVLSENDLADLQDQGKPGPSSKRSSITSEIDQSTPLVVDGRTLQSKLRRYHALLELVDTERAYANDLSVLVHIYFEALPLQPFFEDHPARMETVIRNTPQLLDIHSDIATQLEHALEREGIAATDTGSETDKALSKGVDAAVVSVGTIFSNLDQQLSPYREFCARHAEALAVIREAERRHNGEDFASFERMCHNVLKTRPMSSRTSSTTDLPRISRSASFTNVSTPGGSGRGSTPSFPSLTPVTPPAEVSSALTMTGLSPAPGSGASSLSDVSSGSTVVNSRQTGRLNFADLLIKPVQRLCLYPLVLHTLLKHTGPEDAGADELKSALAMVKKIAEEVDEAGKQREQFLIAELVASRVEPRFPITRSLLSSLGTVDLSGTLDVLYHHYLWSPLIAPLRFRFLGLFLYDGWLLIVKVRKSGSYEARHWFPLSAARMSHVEENEGILPHSLRLTVNGEHHFELAASSSRERALWVQALSAAIVAPSSSTMPLPCNVGSDRSYDASTDYNEVTPRHVVSQSADVARSLSDPLGLFLTQQSAAPGSAEVLVRYASLTQRSVVDKGMIFSDAILSARAITHKDGTFTPGGSLTKSGQATFNNSSAPLTSWHAATSSSTSSLGAAVGAAMGLARAAKRSSRQSTTNVFEAAAQQYLHSEESRRAEEASLAFSRDGPHSNTSEDVPVISRYGGEGGAISPKLMPGSTRKKRASFYAGSSSAQSFGHGFGSTSRSSATSPGARPKSLHSGSFLAPEAVQGGLASPISFTTSPMMEEPQASRDELSLSASQSKPQRLKRRQSGLSAASLKDAFTAANWTRKGRSHSADIDVGQLQPTRSLTMSTMVPDSPTSTVFAPSISSAVPSRSSSPVPSCFDPSSANSSRPASIKRAFTNVTSGRRQRANSISSEAALAPVPQRQSLDLTSTSTPGSLRSAESSLVGSPSAAMMAAAAAPPAPRRKKSGTFANTLSAMAPPLVGSLKRGMSFSSRSWGSGSKSATHSRRGSVVDETIAEDVGSAGPAGLPEMLAKLAMTKSQEDEPAIDQRAPSPKTIPMSKKGLTQDASSSDLRPALSLIQRGRRGSLHRASTDTNVLARKAEASVSASRPADPARSYSSPLLKKKASTDMVPFPSTSSTTALAPFQARGKATPPMSSSTSFLSRTFSKRFLAQAAEDNSSSNHQGTISSSSPSSKPLPSPPSVEGRRSPSIGASQYRLSSLGPGRIAEQVRGSSVLSEDTIGLFGGGPHGMPSPLAEEDAANTSGFLDPFSRSWASAMEEQAEIEKSSGERRGSQAE